MPEFLALLEDATTLEQPAELEHLAATLLIPLAQPELPPEVGSAIVEALQARRDANAAGVLAAFALLAPEPIAEQAHAVRDAADQTNNRRRRLSFETGFMRDAARCFCRRGVRRHGGNRPAPGNHPGS